MSHWVNVSDETALIWADASEETILTFTAINPTVPTWTDASTETILTFGDLSIPSTVSNQNASRFITAGDREDATGGVDFGLQIRREAFFVITSLDPRVISSTTLEDPTG